MDSNEGIVTLKNIVERLIAPDGCPWDRVQTPESLSEYIIEESHELVSAIRYGDADDVCEELGDVAFLLVTIACHFEKKGLHPRRRFQAQRCENGTPASPCFRQ